MTTPYRIAVLVGSLRKESFNRKLALALGANHHLRQSLVFLDMPAMALPEAYVGHAGDLFDDAGTLTKTATREFLTAFMQAFAAWVQPHT
jgi:NAD(P)H-dependent FMN reductase